MEADGFVYERVVLYRADKVSDLSDELQKEIQNGSIDGVLLYSPRTAVSFVELLDKAKLKNNVKNMVAYGLSAAVASKIKDVAFKEIKIAASPDQEALLQCLSEPKDKPMTAKKDDNKKADPKVIDAKAEDVKVKDAPKADTKKPADKKHASKTPEVKKTDTAKPAEKKDDKKTVEDPVEKALKAKTEEKPKKKGSFKTKLMVASVVILAAAGTGAYYTQDIWVPQAKAKIVEVLKLDTVMAQDTASDEKACCTWPPALKHWKRLKHQLCLSL